MGGKEAQALGERVARLEREVRGWRRAAALLAAVVAVAGLLGAAAGPTEEVRARRVLLVDAEGRERASLAVDPDGWVGLRAHDVSGASRLALGTEAAGPAGLSLSDRRSKARLGLAVNTDGLGMLSLFDARGRTRAALSVTPDGEAGLRFAKPGERIYD